MDEQLYVYQPRIVLYIDLLGFENEFFVFQNQALRNQKKNNGELISKKANDFLNVFNDVVRLINDQDCNSYLFTDNICLTFDPDDNKSFFVVYCSPLRTKYN